VSGTRWGTVVADIIYTHWKHWIVTALNRARRDCEVERLNGYNGRSPSCSIFVPMLNLWFLRLRRESRLAMERNVDGATRESCA